MLAKLFQARVSEAFWLGEGSIALLPMVFARAAVSVLPVHGSGVSMTDHLRIPLAASDPHVATAERLQTTLGEGPCLEAAAAGEPLAADLARMAQLWPTFSERLVAETPYRSVASLPLRTHQGTCLGALDLYSTSPDTLTASELAEIDSAIATPVASMLFRDSLPGEPTGITVPEWLDQEQIDNRMNVWVAVGIAMERLDLTNTDALALLRGHAYSHDLALDDLARLMTDRDLDPEALTA